MCLLTVYHIIRFITNVYNYYSLNVGNIRNLMKDISGFVTPFVTFSNGGTRNPYLTVVASVMQKCSILFELTIVANIGSSIPGNLLKRNLL